MDRFDQYLNKNISTGTKAYQPFYSDRADYNTNAPSYYDDLARKQHLFEILAHRIWEYDEELAKRFEEWDRLIENFPEDVKKLLERWLQDGTLADIINEEIFEDLNTLINDLTVRVDTNENNISDLKTLDYKTRKLLYQKRAMRLDLGNANSPLFTGSHKANQGLAYIKMNGKEYVFTLSRVEGSGWSEDERQRISMFEFNDNGISSEPIEISKVINVGHQGISAFIEDNELYLICSASNQKGYTKIKWRGSETCQDDVKEYILIEPNDTDSDPLSTFYNNTTSTDKNGEYIVLSGSTTMDSPLRYVMIYRRKNVECQPEPKNAKPLNVFKFTPPPYINGNVVQDIALDENYIYIASGFNAYKNPMLLSTFGFNGELITYNKIDTMYNEYTESDFKNKTIKIEPEGLAIRDNGNILYQIINDEERERQDGEPSDCCVRNYKTVYELSSYKIDNQSKAINRGVLPLEAPSNIHMHANNYDITVNEGDSFRIGYYNFLTREITDILNYTRQHLFTFYDNRPNSNNNQHVVIGGYYEDNEQYAIIRGDRNNANGGGIDLGTSQASGGSYIKLNTHSSDGVEHGLTLSAESGNIRPNVDNAQSLGSAGYRWSDIYVNNTSSTSDRNLKRNINDISFGLNFINEIRPVQYELLNNDEKHYGIIAQELEKTANDLNIEFDGCKKVKTEHDEEIYFMNYNDLIAPLIKSVQDLSKEVQILKKELGK